MGTRLQQARRWLILACLLLPAYGAEAGQDVPEPGAAPSSGLETPTEFAPVVIGASASSEPLLAYRFGNGPSTRVVLAGIHGGYEWNTTALAQALVEHLVAQPQTVPADVTLWIVPVVNPDGLNRARGVDGRANANGVDINRNFPAFWAADWPRGGCWDYRPITAGSAEASESETLAVMSFLLREGAEAVISYHSAGLGVFPGGQPPDAKSMSLAQSLAEVTGYHYPPIDTGCMYTGQLIDWAAASGMAAVDVELTDHYNIDFELNLAAVTALMTWRTPVAGRAIP
jgi:predicted deacylase